ncbi:hypothetical protein K9U37_01605 [Mycolicibacterium litorale]|uniref:Uncharacterized protein n=1 Tax=Candidatus Mycolicibacterium alkanivorans TaxID=2954114 RepID=A0ABS9YR52_9MYCO|nr:hypothetical protein [Candidatus Mycolicibacterium alkanivorans]MCI4673723.1 hypothetical protein [Candidatus Mycolicibacterium alkanivorans]
MHAARFDLAGPHREPARVGEDLHVAALGLVLARVPQVMALVGALVHPVDLDERPVQRDVRPAFPLRLVEHVVQVGCLVGDHVDRLVQIPVAGGDRQRGLEGQQPHRGVVAEPPQHQLGLRAHRARASPGAGADLAPVRA